jgi:hypothetical protein
MQCEHQIETRQISPNVAHFARVVHLEEAQSGPTQDILQNPSPFMMLSQWAILYQLSANLVSKTNNEVPIVKQTEISLPWEAPAGRSTYE